MHASMFAPEKYELIYFIHSHDTNMLYVASARVLTINLNITIVKVVAAIIVRPVQYGVDSLGGIPASRAVSRVIPVPAAGCDKNTIQNYPLSAEAYRRTYNTRQVIVAATRRPAASTTWRCLGKMIAAPGLVVDNCNKASDADAEGVLRACVGYLGGRGYQHLLK